MNDHAGRESACGWEMRNNELSWSVLRVFMGTVQTKGEVVSGKVKLTTLIIILQRMEVVSMKMCYVLVGVVG